MSGIDPTFASILTSKAAAVVVGAVLVGGAVTAGAVAATTGHIGPIQTPMFGHSTSSNDLSKDHAHTISIEGVLESVKSCPSNVSTIVVTKAAESAEHDVKDTNDNSDSKGDAAQATHAPQTSEKPEATKTPGTETLTVTVNSKTRLAGQADTLGDLCGKTGHRVQVQAEKNSAGALVAWKVTLQGAVDVDHGKGNDATPGASANSADHTAAGAVGSVGKTSFTLKTSDGKTVTVIVNAQTVFAGSAHDLGSLHAGDHVSVHGTELADGSIVATRVE